MGQFFTRERFGHPQFLAGALLLVFLAQCVWLVDRSLGSGVPDPADLARLEQGLRQWHGLGIAGQPHALSRQNPVALAPAPLWELSASDGYDPHHSPLWYLTASLPLLFWPGPLRVESMIYWGWLARAPFLIFGVLLGASLWYVARRLYGNAGGYIALTLYCFSPAVIRSSALWATQPEIGAAWGTFGAIFTAIAVAHTLYAPREVVLWNWRRIFLLGLSLALAVGSLFSLIVIVPLALAFMLYLAPTRRGAATVIWAAACGLALLILCASYSLHLAAFWQGVRHATFFGIVWPAFLMPAAYRQIVEPLAAAGPALVLAIPAALGVYLAWPRARYFGTHAPLLVAALFVLLAVGTPHHPGMGFAFLAVPFLMVFVAGICADLLETPQRSLVGACVWGLLIAQALWNLWQLAALARMHGLSA
ncbi:MAG TPA: hypothetical protein VLV49_17170 [Terriglobales bacterium]|nr:hypothetical protein [Terriglobales bacterium]